MWASKPSDIISFNFLTAKSHPAPAPVSHPVWPVFQNAIESYIHPVGDNIVPNSEDLEQVEAVFRQVKEFQSQGKFLEAVKLLEGLLEARPRRVFLNRSIALLHLGRKDWPLAVEHARKWAQHRPLDDFASRLLFFCLWKSGLEFDAYAEFDRFVNETGSTSDEYELMLRDLNGEIGPEEFDRVAAEIERKKAPEEHRP
jgi:hypothetical protein